jgi:peptidoglycan/LPS O-acetylase OafA/YrhL
MQNLNMVGAHTTAYEKSSKRLIGPSRHWNLRMNQSVMNKNFSLYLDFMRLMAAFMVFLGHAHTILMSKLPSSFFFGQAREAVALFFVLSGFVIAYVTHEKELDWKSYALARAARIYSVAIPAILLTFVLDYLALAIGGQGGMSNNALSDLGLYQPESLVSLVRSLSFTNQLWFDHIVFGSNEPYWSLGFEVPYYIIFGLAVFTSGYIRSVAVVLSLLFFGPKIAQYFPLWLLGVGLYFLFSKSTFKLTKLSACLVYICSLALYLLLWATVRHHVTSIYLTYDLGQEIKNTAYYLLVGVIAAINLASFRFMTGNNITLPRNLTVAIRWLAGASFTLYLAQQPILVFFHVIMTKYNLSTIAGVLFSILSLVLILVMAEFGERRKGSFYNFFKHGLNAATRVVATEGKP